MEHPASPVCLPGLEAHGDVSFSEWTMEVSLTGVGRIKLDQVAVRRWKNGKIVHERFYHE